MQHNHEPRSRLFPYARRLPSVHRSVSAHALGRPNPSKPRCLLTAGALNAKDRGKPPAEPDASLHSLYAETMAGHVEGDDSTETAVRTLTKKEEVAESSSSPARRSVTPLAPGRHDTCASQRAARADTARRTSCCSCCSTLMTGSPRPRSRDQAPISSSRRDLAA